MLHNLEVGSKQLNVKVDEKTRDYLETYKTGQDGEDDVSKHCTSIFVK